MSAWEEAQNFNRNDYVTLNTRGDVWRVDQVDMFKGYTGFEHMLTLEWVSGRENPGRLVRFGSNSARKLTPMEVIALSAE